MLTGGAERQELAWGRWEQRPGYHAGMTSHMRQTGEQNGTSPSTAPLTFTDSPCLLLDLIQRPPEKKQSSLRTPLTLLEQLTAS